MGHASAATLRCGLQNENGSHRRGSDRTAADLIDDEDRVQRQHGRKRHAPVCFFKFHILNFFSNGYRQLDYMYRMRWAINGHYPTPSPSPQGWTGRDTRVSSPFSFLSYHTNDYLLIILFTDRTFYGWERQQVTERGPTAAHASAQMEESEGLSREGADRAGDGDDSRTASRRIHPMDLSPWPGWPVPEYDYRLWLHYLVPILLPADRFHFVNSNPKFTSWTILLRDT
jgi:hypothetical protein